MLPVNSHDSESITNVLFMILRTEVTQNIGMSISTSTSFMSALHSRQNAQQHDAMLLYDCENLNM